MGQIPTAAQLIDISESIAEHGFDAYENQLVEVVKLARRAGSGLASLDEVTNPSTPTAVRSRALGLVVSKWDHYRQALEAQDDDFNQSFQQLLSAWNQHQDLRQSGADVGKLSASRADLDQLRLDAARSRDTLVA